MVSRRIGRYELLCELGRGGMAELFLARLHGVGGFAKPVAIKLILPHLATDRTFVEQFLNEGRIAARLSHPNVCQVYELGEADGQLYLAMEYLEGAAWDELAHALPADVATRVRFTAGVLAQACDGLHHAHQVPVVHRDVSPTNMFVTVDGVCKVLDFGVSKLLTDGKHTRTGVLKGKLPYMSPEQIEGAPIDGRSDVFAAGVMVWEAIADKRLFDRSTDFQIWKAITEEPVPPLGHADLDAMIGKALARDPEQRTRSMRALADELREVARAYGGAATANEIGDLVRDRCRVQIATRAELVLKATTGVTSTPARDEPEPSATVSMAMRGASVVIDRPRAAKWPLVMMGVLGVAIVAVLVISLDKPESKPSPPAPVAVPKPIASAPDAAIDEPPPIDAVIAKKEPVRKKPPKHEGSAVVPVVESQEPGLYTIASKPFARIYIDGVYVDQTPVFRHRLKPGPHSVRAVLDDGRDKTFQIKIAPGKEVNSGTLAW